MSTFNQLEFEVMDELYLLSSFQQIKEATGAPAADLKNVLLSLLQNNYIRQMVYSKSLNDYEPMEIYDESKLESSSYVATKKGLLAHNSND